MIADTIKSAIWILAFLLSIAWMQTRDAEAAQSTEYVKSLERILAKCLSGGDQPIIIGGEIWLCGATPTGIKQ